MKILDSSVIIAFFRENEKFHHKAVNIFLNNSDFLVPDYVLAEVLTVLKIKEGFDVAKKCADFLRNVEDLELFYTDMDIFKEALDYFQTHKNQLSFVDTVIFVLSHSQKIPVETFDEELKKICI